MSRFLVHCDTVYKFLNTAKYSETTALFVNKVKNKQPVACDSRDNKPYHAAFLSE